MTCLMSDTIVPAQSFFKTNFFPHLLIGQAASLLGKQNGIKRM